MPITLQDLLEAGVHFGHQIKRWNPQMGQYIYTQRNGVHIIDLTQTLEALEEAAQFIEDEVAKGKEIVFVGTKRQAKEMIAEEADRCGAMYINGRWPGGLITNYKSVKQTIDKYNKMLEMKETKEVDKLSAKELSVFNKDFERKDKLVGGIKNLKGKPELVFVLDVKRESNAIKESRQAKIPVIAVCDTNSNPNLVDYPIPGNDDALKAIKLFLATIADAVERGMKRRPKEAVVKEAKEESPVVVKSEKPKAKLAKKVEETKEVKAQEKKEKKKDVSVKTLDLTDSVQEKLKEAGITTVAKLKEKTEKELLEIKGLGAKAVKKIQKEIK